MAADMTEGNIIRHLIRYSVPLILGNFFQLAYNAVDSVIAGRFIGKEALAAEGTAGPVMNIVILGISGICMGAGVLMSEFYGAGEHKRLKEEMATVLVFGLVFSMVIAGTGVLSAGRLLLWLRVPEELLPMASLYLRIIFLGAPFTYFYNALAAALKSVGDSKTPLKFLMFSAVLNALLDIIFIGFLGYGIAVSAITTVVAEAVSAVMSLVYIYRLVPALSLAPREYRIHRGLLKQTLKYGSVTALQQACQPVGKLLIQGAVNPLGVDMIAAFQAVNRIDDFAFTPEQSIAHGITTFVAQNRGAQRNHGDTAGSHGNTVSIRVDIQQRIRWGLRDGLLLESAYWVLICLAVTVCKRPLMELFVTQAGSAGVIDTGSRYLGTMAFLYLLPAFTNGIQGYFRGMGKMGITLAGTFIQTGIRVIMTWVLTPVLGIYGVAAACGAGWTVMLLYEVPCCIRWIRRGSHQSQGTGESNRPE